MFRRIYGITPIVAENENFQVKIYLFPDEGGLWHVHIVRRSDGTDAKIGLWDFELKRPSKFSKKSIKDFQRWVFDNRHYLRKRWVQNVLNPMKLFMKENRDE